MRIVFMGTPNFSVSVLDALVDEGHEVVAVYSQPPRPAGRGKKNRPSPVQVRAEALGLRMRNPLSFRDVDAQADFIAFNADIAVVVAYGLILPQVILDAPRLGCLNIHASLLPRWRGAAPIHRAIMAGDRKTGVCIMQMDAGLDTGSVLLREATNIGVTQTTGELHDQLSKVGSRLIVKALATLGGLTAQVQSDDGVTYAKKIDKAEACIDWACGAVQVDRQIRGLSPFPGAWCMVGEERVKLLGSHIADGSGATGAVLSGFTIACADGAISVTRIQRAGKTAMNADQALLGLDLGAKLV